MQSDAVIMAGVGNLDRGGRGERKTNCHERDVVANLKPALRCSTKKVLAHPSFGGERGGLRPQRREGLGEENDVSREQRAEKA